MVKATEFFRKVTDKATKKFNDSQSILAFDQYLERVVRDPQQQLRNCGQFFLDMVKSFGSYEVVTPAKKLTRYRLFDAEFLNGEGKIFGQERIQEDIIGHLNNFVSAGRVDKLLLLHGPNGSAKTSIVQAFTNAAEVYSASDRGALYQFSWVFPKKGKISGSMGFGDVGEASATDSFAKLPSDAIESCIACEVRDHPLLLLSIEEREELFAAIKAGFPDEEFHVPQILRVGELSFKNRQIFDALLSSYHGDLGQVFRHVRVERFYLSRRYKKGISVIEPQMRVDAELRQITSDQSLLGLPSALHHTSLYEALGPLVEANRGIIEYSDLLKRPIDAWKYLLVACEQAQVSVGTLSLFFDLLMIATSNELHLNSFREYPDWQSFKARIELIRVPYLLRSVDEQEIYLHQIPPSSSCHIAPHSIEMAARWAVLTRLEPPEEQKYGEGLREVIRGLSPEEKLDLYNFGDAPARLSQSEARELKAAIKDLAQEERGGNYEGQFGASPREIRTLILNAAQDSRCDHLSAGAIFEQIERLIEQKTSYDFLRREPLRGYRDPARLLDGVKAHYLKILDDEVRSALGLYDKASYADLLTRYVRHISAWTKKEELIDPLLGRRTAADENFMNNVEADLLAKDESKDDFRHQLIFEIAAFKLENPQNSLEYSTLFASHLKKLKESVYAKQAGLIDQIIDHTLKFLDGDREGVKDRDLNRAQTLLKGMYELGYQKSSARWALAHILSHKARREDV